jgi:hypothetical protein
MPEAERPKALKKAHCSQTAYTGGSIHLAVLRVARWLNVCDRCRKTPAQREICRLAGVAEANELRRTGVLEVLEDLLSKLRIPALRAHELAREVAHARERVARVVVEGHVLAEEHGITRLAEDRLLGRLERGIPGGGDDLHEPAVCP